MKKIRIKILLLLLVPFLVAAGIVVAVFWMLENYSNYTYKGKTYYPARNISFVIKGNTAHPDYLPLDASYFSLVKDDRSINTNVYAIKGYSSNQVLALSQDEHSTTDDQSLQGIYLSNKSDDTLSFIKPDKLSIVKDDTEGRQTTVPITQDSATQKFISDFEKFLNQSSTKSLKNYDVSKATAEYELNFTSSLNSQIISTPGTYDVYKRGEEDYVLVANDGDDIQPFTSHLNQTFEHLLSASSSKKGLDQNQNKTPRRRFSCLLS